MLGGEVIPMTRHTWTAPHWGVQHLGEYGTRTFFCTVVDYNTFATLSRYTPGCGFKPIESKHTTAAAARRAGENWLRWVGGGKDRYK